MERKPESSGLPFSASPFISLLGRENLWYTPQLGRVEVSKAAIRKLSPPTLCVNEHIAQFGINPQADQWSQWVKVAL